MIMKPHSLCLLFLLFFSITCVGLHAQNTIAACKLTAYAQHFSIFAKDYPQEKVYLHFDNTAYYLGESLWFKGYVVTAERNAWSQFSKTLYVELVTAEGNILETKKLKIINGQCDGEFRFPATIYAGFYEVRAYTRYMLNWDKEYLFSRVFPVYDKPLEEGAYQPLITARAPSQKIPQLRKEFEQKGNLEVSFFPEGGNLVAGVNSRVAFKAIAKKGENAIISGSIYDEKEQKVADITTDYLDMGSFEFTPEQGKYIARVQYNNKEYSFDLPGALPAGHMLKIGINSTPEKVDILIQKNEATPSEDLGLSISSRGRLYAFEHVTVGEENAILLSIPQKMLPSGVTQITLYNVKGEILGERLVFINHHSEMTIKMTPDKSTYKPYEKVAMHFQFADFKGKPVETTFSAAIHDQASTSANPYRDNVLTNLLLSSEVKGYIDNPGYYFESDDATRAQALDLLLLTQGWCRYSWKQMAGVTPLNVKQPIEKALVIEGTVSYILTKQKNENVDISMTLISDSVSEQGKCLTDKKGEFNFALQDFYGHARLLLQSMQKEKRVEKNILLYRNFSPEIKAYSFAELSKTEYTQAVRDTVMSGNGTQNELDDDKGNASMSKKNHLLKEVVVVKSKKATNYFGPVKVNLEYKVDKELDKMKDSGGWVPEDIMSFIEYLCKYYSASSGKYKGKDVMFLKDNSLQLVSGVSALLMGESNAPAMSTDRSSPTTPNQATGLLPEASGNSQMPADKQASLLPRIEEIESASVIEDFSSLMRIYPLIDPNRTVLIILHCKKNYFKEPYGMRETKYDGYANAKEFYSPRYDYVGLPSEKDYRRTLYWNPNVKTDVNGNASIYFYNNSSCNTMNVSAETVTPNGVIGVLNK